jgi:YYY domain-containing protein
VGSFAAHNPIKNGLCIHRVFQAAALNQKTYLAGKYKEANLIQFAAWWVIIQLLGLAALPLTRRVLRWLPDRGYAFSKAVGLLLVSYSLWLGASSGLLINDIGGILLSLLLLAALSAWIGIGRGWARVRAQVAVFWQQERGHILTTEVLFLLAFAGWVLVRAYAPDKILPMFGEKYMEIAFLNGVLNSVQFPPLDPWLAGYGISYYYFGYVMMAVMTRLSGATATVGFDLYDALLFALTAICAYGVTANLAAASGAAKRAARTAGLLGALFVTLMGNLEGLMEGLHSGRVLPDSFWQWLNIPGLAESGQSGSFYPGHGWWWWRASRVLRDLDLSYNPVIFQPIDEFPFFSFLLGDNHPHKLALPFVLLAVGLALNLMLRLASRKAEEGAVVDPLPQGFTGWRRWAGWAWLQREDIGFYFFYALVLGGLAFLNTWDFPIYLGLVVLAYGAGEYWAGEPLSLRLGLRVLLLGAGLGAVSVLLYFFFYTGFASQAGGILPYVFPPTRLAQYLVMFGPFIFILIFFTLLSVRKTGSGGFPWQYVLRAWLWIAGLLYAVYLLVLVIGGAVLMTAGGRLPAYLQEMLGSGNIGSALLNILQARLVNPWLFLLLSAMLAVIVSAVLRGGQMQEGRRLTPPALFALLLAFAGLALTFAVDFFYLRDNFGLRMNTVFKFYFQGWVMMALASAFGVWWVSKFAGQITRALFLVGTALLIAAGLVYPSMAIYARTDGFTRTSTLDSAATFAGLYGSNHWAAKPDDWAVIEWMRENIPAEPGNIPLILEAPGGAYENNGRVSAFTGFPTLLGWTNHQGQWRGGQEEIRQREPDIITIFTTASPEVAWNLLQLWEVDYVIIGNTERDYIQRTCDQPEHRCTPRRALEKFEQFLLPLFTHGETTIYAVPD